MLKAIMMLISLFFIFSLFTFCKSQSNKGDQPVNNTNIITREKAKEIAISFMKQLNLFDRYLMDSPHISIDDDEYNVEFNDIQRDIEPGVCIIGVNMKTGAARIIPVE